VHRCRVVVVILGLAFLVALALPAILMVGRVYPPRVAVDETPTGFGLAFEDVDFASRDGVELRGWYLEPTAPTGRAVVLAHGIDDNRLQSGVGLPLAAALVERGFAVLLFDLRGSGDSARAAQTLGAHESGDVLAAVDLVRSRGADRDSARLLEAARNPMTQRWLVTGGRHTVGYKVAPAEYTRRVLEFFETYL
jgi:hypothetical protein